MAGKRVDVSDTAMMHFSKQVHKKFLSEGNQLKRLLGGQWKVSTKSADTIRFYLTTEAKSYLKPAAGSLIKISDGGKITYVDVTPQTYLVTTILEELEMDSTGINLIAEFENIHARAMGLRTDDIIMNSIIGTTFKDENSFTGIKLEEYDTADGVLKIVKRTAAIGGKRKKYLIVDTNSHAKLLENEKFISNLYGTANVVNSGTLDGATRLGWTILLLDELDETFHGKNTMLPDNTCYIVTEESIGAGMHKDSVNSYIKREITLNNDYVILTDLSLACITLTNRAMYKIEWV